MDTDSYFVECKKNPQIIKENSDEFDKSDW